LYFINLFFLEAHQLEANEAFLVGLLGEELGGSVFCHSLALDK
jgi:hypothetical protein